MSVLAVTQDPLGFLSTSAPKEGCSVKAGAICGIFDEYRKTGAKEDLYGLSGRAKLHERVYRCIQNGEPISFVFPGFPAKSPNTREKVLGDMPDMAEEVAFAHMGKFLSRVEQAYKPGGVIFNVVSDGLVFGDIVGVPVSTICKYERVAREMAAQFPIRWYTLNDFYPSGTVESKINALMCDFGVTDEELHHRVTTDPDTRMLFNGMHLFMQADIPWPREMSKTKMKDAAKKVAHMMMIRSEAYTKLIAKNFPNAIRLSIHPSTNAGQKYSFSMYPGDTGWSSPWHNVMCVKKDGSFQLGHKCDAEAQGMVLQYKDNRPYYFAEVQN